MFRSLLGSSSLYPLLLQHLLVIRVASMSMPFSSMPRPRLAYMPEADEVAEPEAYEVAEPEADDHNQNVDEYWYNWSWYNNADIEATSMQEAMAPPMMTPEKILTRQLAMDGAKEAAIAALTRMCEENTGLRLHILQYVLQKVGQMSSARDAAIVVQEMEIITSDMRGVMRPVRDFLVLGLSTEIDPWHKDDFRNATVQLFDRLPSADIQSQIFLSYRRCFSTNISGNLPQRGRRRPRAARHPGRAAGPAFIDF